MQESHPTRETEQKKFHSYNNPERGVSVLGSGGAFVSPCVSTLSFSFTVSGECGQYPSSLHPAISTAPSTSPCF
ncbi:hypothetical protein VNO80_03058 [Phaseolus coccineus]|uniref:Uncharacterized protein n=1 Tax=Phaseolus coccineus TaxID=3886 RepID=A0AAN9RMT4_PHACN